MNARFKFSSEQFEEAFDNVSKNREGLMTIKSCGLFWL